MRHADTYLWDTDVVLEVFDNFTVQKFVDEAYKRTGGRDCPVSEFRQVVLSLLDETDAYTREVVKRALLTALHKTRERHPSSSSSSF